jgi:hypothetical protein
MSPIKIQVHDAVSYSGRDYVVEGVISYESGAESWQLARAVDGDVVLWIEPPHSEIGDRLLVLREIRDLEISPPPPTPPPPPPPPPPTGLEGRVPERSSGGVMLWRFRAAGDLYLQLEEGAGRVSMLAGESVHRGMIEVLPGR